MRTKTNNKAWETRLFSLVLIATLLVAGCGSGSEGSSNSCECDGIECFFAIMIIPILPLLCTPENSTAAALGLDLFGGDGFIHVDSPLDYFLSHEENILEMEGTVSDPHPGTFDMGLYQGPIVIISNVTSGMSWLAEVNYSSLETDNGFYHWLSPLSLGAGTVVPGANRIVVEVDYGGGIYASKELRLNVSLGSTI